MDLQPSNSLMAKRTWSEMAVRYIGSKARLADDILAVIGPPKGNGGRFIDGFCGTGVVAKTAALSGWSVSGSDTLFSSVLLAKASLLCPKDLDFTNLSSYEKAIDLLNNVEPKQGFIWREYSPASVTHTNIERRYFTEINAQKIDAIRELIEDWYCVGLIGDNEKCLLVADLIEAANSVANIAGTYGCFLKKWTPQSQGLLVLKKRSLLVESVDFDFSVTDVFDLKCQKNDTVYLDPPYTKRQYGSYYHIPETIAYYDNPDVEGVAGLRPWKQIASPFCYKTKALGAITECVRRLGANDIFLSYSSQGHVELCDLEKSLSGIGEVALYRLGSIGRYRPNRKAAETGHSVEEYLIHINRHIDGVHS